MVPHGRAGRCGPDRKGVWSHMGGQVGVVQTGRGCGPIWEGSRCGPIREGR